jgi:hypothetical protein
MSSMSFGPISAGIVTMPSFDAFYSTLCEKGQQFY